MASEGEIDTRLSAPERVSKLVTHGEFNCRTPNIEEEMLILGLISEWEAELLKPSKDVGSDHE